MAHKIIPPRTYLAVYAALLLLTLTTVWIAVGAHLGVWEVPVALGIATVKTVLVGLFFMHLLHSSRLVWLIIATAVLFLFVMMAFTLSDYWTRDMVPGQSHPVAVHTR